MKEGIEMASRMEKDREWRLINLDYAAAEAAASRLNTPAEVERAVNAALNEARERVERLRQS